MDLVIFVCSKTSRSKLHVHQNYPVYSVILHWSHKWLRPKIPRNYLKLCLLTLNDETIYKLDCYWLIKSVEANLNGLDYSETSWQQSMHNFCAVCKILYLLCNIFSFGNIYFLFKLILLLQNFAHQYTNITKLINQIFGEMSQRHSHSMQFVVTKILYGRVYLDILNENLMLPLWPRVSQP